MLNVKDRQPTLPGRRKITYEDGTYEYVTIETADNPIEVGTPLNRGLFMDLQGFSTENTTISENGNVTTVTVNHADGGLTVTKITIESETRTKVISVYTSPDGYKNTKETTIDTSGENIVIGGVAS